MCRPRGKCAELLLLQREVCAPPEHTDRCTESDWSFWGTLSYPIIFTISSWQGDLPGAVQVAWIVARETRTEDDTAHLGQHPSAASWQHRHREQAVNTGATEVQQRRTPDDPKGFKQLQLGYSDSVTICSATPVLCTATSFRNSTATKFVTRCFWRHRLCKFSPFTALWGLGLDNFTLGGFYS